jgi:hypothetical protein
MNDRLKQLLLDADRAAPQPPPLINLAARAARIAIARRRRRRAATSLLTIAFLAAALALSLPRRHDNQLRQQLQSLQTQADHHMQLALQLEKQNPLVGATPASPSFPLSPRERAGVRAMTRTIVASRMFQLQIDQAALGLLYEADRLAKNPATRDTAREFYRQIATELPPGAATDPARQRLAAMKQGKET